MLEIVTASFSQAANHVVTHMYNTQESHIPYRKNQPIVYQNDVFMNTSAHDGGVDYLPRALVYDLKGGLGALGKYEYHEPALIIDQSKYTKVVSANVNATLSKNEFQVLLDKGKRTLQSLLNTDNTRYWTDYNKLIYNPRSIHTLNGYVIDLTNPGGLGTHQHFEKFKFSTFNVGKADFMESQDKEAQLDNFRWLLERCDRFEGLNVLTDLDSAWAGYTNEFIQAIKDDYFNNGNGKHCMWALAMLTGANGQGLMLRVSRIKGLVELSRTMSVVMPINMQFLPNSSMLSSDFDSSSLWHTSGVSSMFTGSLWELQCQASNNIPLSVLEGNLLRGVSGRNIVNEISLTNDNGPLDTQVMDVSIEAYLAASATDVRTNMNPPIDTPDLPSIIDLGLIASSQSSAFVKNYISPAKKVPGPDQSCPVNQYTASHLPNLTRIDTFPSKILSDSSLDFSSQFSITVALKPYLKEQKKLVEGICRGRKTGSSVLVEILEDPQEFTEDLSTLISEYTQGYESDSDEYD